MIFNGLENAYRNGYWGKQYPLTGRTQKSNAGCTGSAERKQETAGNTTFITQLQNKAETSETQISAYAGYIANISRAYSTGKPNATNFEDAFPMYDVVTHVGNTDVSSVNWQRNDFPFWKYFDKNASADCLNNWQPKGPNPPLTDANIQRNLGSIGIGKMAILIPEELQAKMDADEEYAREIMAKVQKWKEDYDRRDNALAASYGYDVAEYQAGKNYCLQLDENGDVVNATVSGSGGRITQSSDEMVKAYYARKKKQAEYKRIAQENAVRRELREEAAAGRHYQSELAKEASLAAYHSSFLVKNRDVL